MRVSFGAEPHTGKPKILFIGYAESTHTHSWIDLLEDSELNVRLFGLPSGVPPNSWKVRTYVTGVTAERLDPTAHIRLYPRARFLQLAKKGSSVLFFKGVREREEKWLAKIIRKWRPDIIHTLGLEPASYLFQKVRERFKLHGIGKWVVQVRGGPDLALHRLLPEYSDKIRNVFEDCDQMIADNEQNYEYALEMGLAEEKQSALQVVPGTGGVDVAGLSNSISAPSSRKRIILWPKAYECPQGKALPVFEAIKQAWGRIQPCEIRLLAMIPETRMWFQTLPEEIRRCCRISERVPRDEVLQLLKQARVVLAPSLADGVPNILYEAMATGAFPIVSPLETIRAKVADVNNVLFARNLFPDEIADALLRAMSDDTMIDNAARRNLQLVKRIADRSKIRGRVISYYQDLANSLDV
ncbi:MAG: glycosyltransferase [Acidobacteriota bacterium]|nr:glycosyltransferase [Acidobacteriota bacterium]